MLIVFASFSLPFEVVEGYRAQEIVLYTEEGYKGRQKSYYEAHPSLRNDSVGKIAKSHCVVRGL